MIHAYYKSDKFGCNYHYGVTKGGTAYTAFRTTAGFLAWVGLHGAKLTLTKESKGYKSWDIDQEHKDISFWDTKDIPEKAIRFLGLSNGSYVDCFLVRGEVNTVYRPNPNAKGVWVPYDYRVAEKFIESGSILLDGVELPRKREYDF